MQSATLTQAAHDGDHAALCALLAAGSNPNTTDALGWTPLLYAVLAGEDAMVDALVRAGADVNCAAPDGTTPLIKAALWGRIQIVRALITAGADPKRRDHGGWSALDLAEAGQHPDVAQLLRAEKDLS